MHPTSKRLRQRRRFSLCVCTLGAIFFVGVSAQGADWPQYRGPDRDGLSGETGLAALASGWGETGPTESWRIPIGAGFSGMAVVGNTLYTLDSDAENEYAVAFDTATGKERWRVVVGGLFENGFGNGPRATPTIDGDTAYVQSSLGNLVALDARTGKERWKVNFPKAFGSELPNWGFAGSPLVVENRLLIQPGGSEGASIVALEKSSGRVLWKAGDEKAGYSSPLMIEVGGVRQVIVLTPAHVVSVTPDGKILWQEEFEPRVDIKPAMPVFVEPDLIFASASYDVGSLTLRVKATENGGASAERVWRESSMRNHFNSSLVLDGHLIGFDNSTLKCIEAASNEVKWAKRGGMGKGSLILADDRFILLTETGTLKIAEAKTSEYSELASARVLTGRSWTSPTLADGKLFLRNRDEMVAIDLTTVGTAAGDQAGAQ